MPLAFDELNVLAISTTTFEKLNEIAGKRKQKHIDIDRYFDEMELSELDAEMRKQYARRMDEILFAILALLFMMLKRNAYDNVSAIKNKLANDLLRLTDEFTSPDTAMQNYIYRYSENFIQVTVLRAQLYTDDQEEKLAYWFSEDRSTFNAENEANTIFNYDDYRIAKEQGMTQKQWLTMRDERVRQTHAHIDGMIIPIDALFPVGEAMLRYPKDWEMGESHLEELISCRCTIRYF